MVAVTPRAMSVGEYCAPKPLITPTSPSPQACTTSVMPCGPGGTSCFTHVTPGISCVSCAICPAESCTPGIPAFWIIVGSPLSSESLWKYSETRFSS